jgi:hypothetical protein
VIQADTLKPRVSSSNLVWYQLDKIAKISIRKGIKNIPDSRAKEMG